MPDFDHVLSSTLDDDTTAWLTELLGVIESLDADAYAAWMSDDAELRLPGGTILSGPQAVADALRGAWATTASLVHHELHLRGDSQHLVHEARVVTTAQDGSPTTSQSTSWIERDTDGQLRSARVYA